MLRLTCGAAARASPGALAAAISIGGQCARHAASVGKEVGRAIPKVAGATVAAASSARSSCGIVSREGAAGSAGVVDESKDVFRGSWTLPEAGPEDPIRRCLATGRPLTREELYCLRETLMLEFM
mmetsp:Transcript_11/g.22  ORF Transcript_11/g.22 Transcript_11/m.22 type:complete len:125 (+) Transcript_11:119-493(+)